MPEHAQLSSIRVNPLQGLDGVVRAQVLMIFGDKLDESDLRLHEEREIFNQVQQSFVVAQPPEHRLQRTRPLLLLGADSVSIRRSAPNWR